MSCGKSRDAKVLIVLLDLRILIILAWRKTGMKAQNNIFLPLKVSENVLLYAATKEMWRMSDINNYSLLSNKLSARILLHHCIAICDLSVYVSMIWTFLVKTSKIPEKEFFVTEFEVTPSSKDCDFSEHALYLCCSKTGVHSLWMDL